MCFVLQRAGGEDSSECRSFFNAPSDQRDIRKQLRYGVDNTTGGGGGGGASFIFKVQYTVYGQ